MRANDLNRAVADATGESVSEIRRRGFGPAQAVRVPDPEPNDIPRFIDWDELQGVEPVPLIPGRLRRSK